MADTIAVDLAKSVFEIVVSDEPGKIASRAGRSSTSS